MEQTLLENNGKCRISYEYESEDDSHETASRNDDKFKSTISLREHTSYDRDVGTFLNLIADKNKLISSLKGQVYNQKLQLGFYLHRAFGNTRIHELSETCEPNVMEENLNVNLAMNRFCQESGIKSRIANLYERMMTIDNRVQSVVETQETVLKTVMEQLVKFAKDKPKSHNWSAQLSEFLSSVAEVDLFNNILGATLRLRQELDNFRVSCNRLVIIEDERNALVEQVYSIPPEQRLSYNYVLTVQNEKKQLEKEIKQIRNDQTVLKERVIQLATIERSLRNCKKGNIKTKQPDNLTGFHIRNMLEMINSDAALLLAGSKDQKKNFVSEISKLKEENTNLIHQLKTVSQVVKEKDEMEQKVINLESMYNTLTTDLEHEKNEESSEKNVEINALRLNLQNAIEENNTLHHKLEGVYVLEQEVKILRFKVHQIDELRRERDSYKSQVDDLMAIRDTYTQLLGHCPVTIVHGDEPNRCTELQLQLKKMEEFEKDRNELSFEVARLNEAVAMQESQIKHLLLIIDKLGEYVEPEEPKKDNFPVKTDEEYFPTNINIDSYCSPYTTVKGDVFVHSSNVVCNNGITDDLSKNEPNEQYEATSMNQDDLNFNTYMCQSAIMGDLPFITLNNMETIKLRTDDYIENVFSTELSSHFAQCSSQTLTDVIATEEGTFLRLNSIPDSSVYMNSNSTLQLPCSRESGSYTISNSNEVNSESNQKHSTVSTTSFEIRASGRDGTEEMIKTVVESSSPVKGLIKMKLTCNQNQQAFEADKFMDLKRPLTPTCNFNNYCNEPQVYNCEVDEYEIMKNCSHETLVACAPSELYRDGNKNTKNLNGDHVTRDDRKIDNFVSNRFQFCPFVEEKTADFNEIFAKANQVNTYNMENKQASLSNADITNQLRIITTELDQTLAQPGGKASMLSTLKTIYNTFFSEDSPYAKN